MSSKLRFGVFLAPLDKLGINPTLALHHDLKLVAHLDCCGSDEPRIIGHHSAGSGIITSPEIFITTAAERTRHNDLGTGALSLSYQNPLCFAERIVRLDHLTRGRIMLGVGPGALPTDAKMIGIGPSQTRAPREDRLGCII